MSSGFPTPPVQAPSTLASGSKGPSPKADPRAREAFEQHLGRELEPPRGRAHGARPCPPHGKAHAPHDVDPGARPLAGAPGACAGAPPPPGATTAGESQPAAPDAVPAEAAVPAAPAPEPVVAVVATPAPAALPTPAPPADAAAPAEAPVTPFTASVAESGPVWLEADPLSAAEAPAMPAAQALAAGEDGHAPPAGGAPAPAIPATPAAPAGADEQPATPATAAAPAPAASAAPAPADEPAPPAAGAPAPAPAPGDEPKTRPDRAPGPPGHAAAWQQAAPPAHAASPLAGNAPVDGGQQTAPPAPAASAPAAPAAAAAPAERRPGVVLTHAAETLRLTISAANAQGVSRARIALRPAELGGVEIALAHGPAGLSATVTADSAQAAHALQRAADELQRTLAAQGLSLVSLQIDVAGERPSSRGREDRGTSADDHGAGEAGTAEEPTAARTIELPNGVLVDVLA